MRRSAHRRKGSGVVNDGTGDGDALLLTAGKHTRRVFHAVSQADARQGAAGTLLAPAFPGIDQRQLDVSQGGRPGQQVELLEDKSQVQFRISASVFSSKRETS